MTQLSCVAFGRISRKAGPGTRAVRVSCVRYDCRQCRYNGKMFRALVVFAFSLFVGRKILRKVFAALSIERLLSPAWQGTTNVARHGQTCTPNEFGYKSSLGRTDSAICEGHFLKVGVAVPWGRVRRCGGVPGDMYQRLQNNPPPPPPPLPSRSPGLRIYAASFILGRQAARTATVRAKNGGATAVLWTWKDLRAFMAKNQNSKVVAGFDFGPI